MFLWSEKDFDRLPADEAGCCQSGNRRDHELVETGLERVLAAYGGVDPGYRGVWHAHEERVVISTYSSVEESQLVRRKILVIFVSNILDLYMSA